MSDMKNIFELLAPAPLKVPKNIAIELDDHDGIDNESILIMSTQDWSDLWTRKQRFALQFARQGNKVLYIESQFHWLSYIKQFKRHWRRLYLFLLGPREVEKNLYVYTPPLLLPAFQILPTLAIINNWILSFFLKTALKKLSITRPIFWTYTHFNKPLVKKLNCKKALYECVDDYAGAKGLIKASVVRQQEKETLRTVSATIVTADTLKPLMTPHNDNVHIINNAANQRHFNRAVSATLPEPDDIKQIPHPRLVFLGMVQYWVDQHLLLSIATTHPDWHIVIVGPVAVDISEIEQLPNIHFVGRKPYDDLPAYMAHCDIALNPYKVDDVAKGCSPLKLYEYLAAGLPVVSTEMPEARKFESVVKVARTYREYITHIEHLLGLDSSAKKSLQSEAVTISQQHSWEHRFLQAESVLKETLQ